MTCRKEKSRRQRSKPLNPRTHTLTHHHPNVSLSLYHTTIWPRGYAHGGANGHAIHTAVPSRYVALYNILGRNDRPDGTRVRMWIEKSPISPCSFRLHTFARWEPQGLKVEATQLDTNDLGCYHVCLSYWVLLVWQWILWWYLNSDLTTLPSLLTHPPNLWTKQRLITLFQSFIHLLYN